MSNTLDLNTTGLKSRVTKALSKSGLSRDIDYHYSNEGDYAFSPTVRGTIEHGTLALYPRVSGDDRNYASHTGRRQIKSYAIATALLELGFKVEIQQNHAGDSGCVLVSLRDNPGSQA